MDTKKNGRHRETSLNSEVINVINAMDFADGFTVEKISEMELNKAKKIPISRILRCWGRLFRRCRKLPVQPSQLLPVRLRRRICVGGFGRESVRNGKLAFNINGATVGNIMGERGIDSRMRFKPIDEVSVKNTITTRQTAESNDGGGCRGTDGNKPEADWMESRAVSMRCSGSWKPISRRNSGAIWGYLAEIMEDFERKGKRFEVLREQKPHGAGGSAGRETRH